MQEFARLEKAWECADNFQKERIIDEMQMLGTPEAWEFIRNVLSDQQIYPHVRGWAARALRSSRDQKTILLLLNRLEWDADPFVRAMCAESLARNAEHINVLGRATRENAIRVLREACASNDLNVWAKSVLALARLRDGQSVDEMVRALNKLDIVEGMTDYEEIALALCEMGEVRLSTVIAFAKTMEASYSPEHAEKMLKATGELLRKRHINEAWRSRLAGAMRVCRNKLEASKRPAGESFIDDTLGVRFARPSIAKPIPSRNKAK